MILPVFSNFMKVTDILQYVIIIPNFRVNLRPLRVILEEICWGQKFLKIWFYGDMVYQYVPFEHSNFYGLIDFQLLFKRFNGGNQTT